MGGSDDWEIGRCPETSRFGTSEKTAFALAVGTMSDEFSLVSSKGK